MADDPESKRTPLSGLREAWLALTGTIASAEDELHRRLHDALGLPLDADLASELMARVRKNSAELERLIDEGVGRALGGLRAPVEKELGALRERLEALQAKIDARRRQREARPGSEGPHDPEKP